MQYRFSRRELESQLKKMSEKKLIKVLQYLHGTLDLTLTLTGSEDMIVTAYIDASYAVHNE